jgi:hypothetical protein
MFFTAMKKIIFLLCCLACCCLLSSPAQAQSARLGIQGILKKANGNAVDDGNYDITFRLYTSTIKPINQAIWMEVQPNLEVSSGIYSATLGSVVDLDLPFDSTYYLGVSVNGQEMLPRIQLTTAPYALALIGNTNQFPSSGLVEADSMTVKHHMRVGDALAPSGGSETLKVNGGIRAIGGIRAEGGAPGLNGANNNGYAFQGNSGDNDSGLFSTGDGVAVLYANNTERLQVNATGVQVSGPLASGTTTLTVNDSLTVNGKLSSMGNLALGANSTVVYNGLSDWRLIDRDEFESGVDGWQAYTNASLGVPNPSPLAAVRKDYGDFNGWVVGHNSTASNGPVIKKQFTGLPNHSQIRVVFTYYFTDSWDSDENDTGWGGFSNDQAGNVVIKWVSRGSTINPAGTTNYFGGSWEDTAVRGEMTAPHTANSVYVVFGAWLSDSVNDENFAVGSIEVWVR